MTKRRKQLAALLTGAAAALSVLTAGWPMTAICGLQQAAALDISISHGLLKTTS